MAQQHVLDVRERERPLHQRIIKEVNLADRQIVGSAPVGIHLLQQFRRESGGICFHVLYLFLGQQPANHDH